jgi:hypothetical protein
MPKSIDFEAELPRTPTGKLVKRHLRDKYWPKSVVRVTFFLSRSRDERSSFRVPSAKRRLMRGYGLSIDLNLTVHDATHRVHLSHKGRGEAALTS